MRKEIVSSMKEQLKDVLEIPVYAYEPDWSQALSYPLCFLDLGDESIKEGLPSKAYRSVQIGVVLVHRGLKKDLPELKEQLYDLADTVDDTLHNMRLTVGEKTVRLFFDSAKWDRVFTDDGYAIVGVEIAFSAMFAK